MPHDAPGRVPGAQPSSLRVTVGRLLSLIRGRDRRRLWALATMMMFAALLEAAGIGLVVPLLVAMTQPEVADQGGLMGWLVTLGAGQAGMFVFAGALLGMFVVKNVFLAAFTWLKARYQFGLQVTTSRRLLDAYLTRPYAEHVKTNTADSLRNVNDEVRWTFSQSLGSLLTLMTEGFTVGAVIILLLALDPIVATFSIVIVGSLAAGFFQLIRRRSAVLGKQQQNAQGQLNRVVAQALGSFKETRLLGSAPYFLDRYEEASRSWADTNVHLQTVNVLPRYVLETVAVLGMVVAMLLARWQGLSNEAVLMLLSVVALAAVRLAPSATRIVSALTVLTHFGPAVAAVSEGLESVASSTPVASAPQVASSSEDRTVHVDGVCFEYEGAPRPTLSDVTLKIERGEMVALVGSSGAGKSTLADILLGLLTPDRGEIRVGDTNIADALEAWQRSIGYVPQQVYLIDSSVRRNVAFGIEDERIDDARVWEVLEHARIADFVREQPGGLDAIVGENGVRISGGQRQRLGIARALYHDPDVLVLDEATSALDNRTERQVTDTILGLRSQLTIIVIAHRLSTVRECDRLFLLREGVLVASGTFDELQATDAEFAAMVRQSESN